MKLLVVTQVIDQEDPVLGFFHTWLGEFAQHFESIEAICLREGKHVLPENVHVSSLGKEKGAQPTFLYAFRFLMLVWKKRREYDAVLVHMNQEYILLAGPLWGLLDTPVYLWRNHYAGDFLTDAAVGFCRKVFCTSQHSYTARFTKTIRMPVGIDITRFAPTQGGVRTPHSILSLGRIAPSKNLHVLVEALGLLQKRGSTFMASIYGNALSTDAGYLTALKSRATELGLAKVLTFYPGLTNAEAVQQYNMHELFVNLSPQGMFDKTMLESAACGCVPVVSNEDLAQELPPECIFKEADAEDLARALAQLLVEKSFDTTQLEKVVAAHSLTTLATKLSREIKG